MKRNMISGFLAATMLFASGSLFATAVALGPGMLGPAHPAIVDVGGAGMPSASGSPVGMSYMAPNLMLFYPSTCATPLITFGNMVGGKYQMATMMRGNTTDVMSITKFMGGRPTDWSLMEGSNMGDGGVMDRNGDGVYDAIRGMKTGGGFSFDIGLVYASVTGHSYGDYVSIPWAEASLLGVGGNCKVDGMDPQVFVPMADTNGDGVPDSIVFDFNNTGSPDPAFPPGPIISGPNQPLAGVPVSGPPIPTFSQWAVLVATLALAGVGWLQLKKGPALL
jgi:hypothetical protein